jgi:hypothetical protein
MWTCDLPLWLMLSMPILSLAILLGSWAANEWTLRRLERHSREIIGRQDRFWADLNDALSRREGRG